MSGAIQTQYGFKYGACEIKRLCSHKEHVMLELATERASLHIRVTPSGLIRIEQVDGSKQAVKLGGGNG